MQKRVRWMVVASLLMVGCARGGVLEPAAAGQKSPIWEDALVAYVQNVEVTAQVDQWPGEPEVRQFVTPVRVLIDNNSNKRVRITYDQFTLQGSDGTTYKALPLYKIHGSVEQPIAVSEFGPAARLGVDYRSFTVAPYAAGLYDITPYRGPFFYDPMYYDSYYDYWATVPLPTAEMVGRALPEGVLAPGGRLSGYLYFEVVPPDRNKVHFTADLVNADTSNQFGMVTLPFKVEG